MSTFISFYHKNIESVIWEKRCIAISKGPVQTPYNYFGSRTLRFRIPFIKGNDIKVLQTLLNLLPDDIVSNRLKPDGVFGNSTRNAVKQLQRYFDLRADGIVGPDTFYVLGHRMGPYASSEHVISSRILKSEMNGADITILQNRLAAFRKTYLNRPASGRFDVFTAEAVKRFQEDFPQLSADGIVGPETFDQIFTQAPLGGRTLRRGRNGLDTYILQLGLYILKYFNRTPHGFFCALTEKAVRGFQENAQIKADGIVGPQTYLALGTSLPLPQKEYLYRAKQGDSVFKISALFGKSMEEIIKLNNLDPPDYIVYTGQLLNIPVPLTFHLAQKGDTLVQLSKKYAIPMEDIEKANSFLLDSYMLPDESIILPRYQQDLEGRIVYINQKPDLSELKTLELSTSKTNTLASLPALKTRNLFLTGSRKKVSVLADAAETNIITYDLETGLPKRLLIHNETTHLDWSEDSQKILLNNGKVLNSLSGEEIFSFEGGAAPQWLNDSNRILYMLNSTVFETINISTGKIKELQSLPDESAWFLRLNNDNSQFIFFAFIPPGRVTATYLYNFSTKQIKEISLNDFAAEWGRTSTKFLLLERNYYGEFFPWFYLDYRLFNSEGVFISRQLYTKNAGFDHDNFSPDDTWLALIIHNPDTFYPIKVRDRDIYIKKCVIAVDNPGYPG
ncbi:MAG TPA: peptidoglycan-binding protein [Syntrophomonadaceae bacterium]|nr:peptidoglycan-binding protein [Syntrophomonadaceae bacterium]